MKYIDTKSFVAMKSGIMHCVEICEDELEVLFNLIQNNNSDKESWKIVDVFLENTNIVEHIDYIQLYHLSRRLNDTDLTKNWNLQKVLLDESPLTKFFRKYDVTFELYEGKVNMFYNGQLVEFVENGYGGYKNTLAKYFKRRLGHMGEPDYCVNGFMFRFSLEDEMTYFNALNRCPEFVDRVAKYLDIKGMKEDYCINSKYYCMEYIIPIDEVIISGMPLLMTKNEKELFLYREILLKLYDIKCGVSCCDNRILRLDENVNIKSEWFVNAEELVVKNTKYLY